MIRQQQLPRPKDRQLVGKCLGAVGAWILRSRELAGGEVEHRRAESMRVGRRGHRDQQRRLASFEIPGVRESSGRDHAYDFAADEPLDLARVFDLLADCDPKALAHETGDVGVSGVMRNAAHRNGAAARVFRP